jgi:hypothetical protein
MLLKKMLASAVVLSALLCAPAVAGSQKTVDSSVLASLKSIRQDAELIASGRLHGKTALLGPARDIAVKWASVEPDLSVDGNAIVETKMANASIAALERDWQTGKNVRGEARDVSGSIDDLTDAATGQ